MEKNVFWQIPCSVGIRTQEVVQMFEQEEEGKGRRKAKIFHRIGKNKTGRKKRIKFKSEKTYKN